MTYRPPSQSIRFLWRHVAHFDGVASLPAFAAELSPELADAIVEAAGQLASEVWAPTYRAGDAGAVLRDGQVQSAPGFKAAFDAFVAGGWMGVRSAPEHGGMGLPHVLAMAVEELCCSANLALSLAPMLTQSAITALSRHGSPALQALYLPRLIAGEWTGTMNLTEPQAGSDLAQIRTRAVPADDHYLITGQKIYITWGEQDLTDNIIHMVLARLPDAPPGVKGISLFLVPKFLVNADGSLGARNDVHCLALEHKLGIHGSPTCVMAYGDNGGAVGYLVGEPHRGLNYMFTMMNQARLGVGVEGMALSERACQLAADFARTRLQSRALESSSPEPVPIIQHPDVRRMLFGMQAQTTAMRALCYYSAAQLDYAEHHPAPAVAEQAAQRASLLIPIVKGWCTEQVNEVTSLAIQIHGGMGYSEDCAAAQLYRDARITAIYEGTTGIQANDLLHRKILADHGVALQEWLREIGHDNATLATDLTLLQTEMANALDAAESSLAWLLSNAPLQLAAAAAGAVPMLKLLGTLAGGWLLAKQAQAARRELASQLEADTAWLNTQVNLAHFFAAHQLPQCLAWAAAIQKGSASVLNTDWDAMQ